MTPRCKFLTALPHRARCITRARSGDDAAGSPRSRARSCQQRAGVHQHEKKSCAAVQLRQRATAPPRAR
eukprot:8496833-Pyramimonas_sp.AAC.1